jgi:hypothetical protein
MMVRAPCSVLTQTLFLVLSAPAYSNSSLCKTAEEVVFSCQVENGKSVSVCATRFSPEGANIAYRFGSENGIELELVADTSRKSPPIEHNWASGTRAYSYFVRFYSGEFSYTIQNHWDGCPGPGETRCKKYSDFTGVLVSRSEKLLARHTCKPNSIGIDSELLDELNVPISEKWPQ